MAKDEIMKKAPAKLSEEDKADASTTEQKMTLKMAQAQAMQPQEQSPQ